MTKQDNQVKYPITYEIVKAFRQLFGEVRVKSTTEKDCLTIEDNKND